MAETPATLPGLDPAELTQAPVAAAGGWLGRLPLLCCWLVAVWPMLLWLLAHSEPELAVRMAQIATRVAIRGGIGAAIVIGIGLLLFPPFPAWVRLALHRMRLSFANDRSPLLKAIAELQHFESAQRHLEAGRLALVRSELPLAATHLARAVELDPGVASANYQFGLLLFRVGRVDIAQQAFERAEALDRGHAFGSALLEAGRCALLAGDGPAAVRLLEQHQREHGGGRKSHYWLGKARAANGDHGGAIEAMRFAAAPVTQRLVAEENWFRALARVWLWRGRRA